MYLAYASKLHGDHIGSTVIHKDVTSAYNIALDVANLPTGEPGYALWCIWPAWSSAMLEEYILDNNLSSSEEGNPIHGHNVYLNETHIERFSQHYNVRPYVFRQRKGDAVFIPPNCPHSVCLTSLKWGFHLFHIVGLKRNRLYQICKRFLVPHSTCRSNGRTAGA